MRGQIARQEPLARQREADALALRMSGATYAAIGRELGMTESAARRAYRRGLERLAPVPEREEARALEAARLDELSRPYWKAAAAGVTEAADTLLKIMTRRARLLGLDAPAEVHVQMLIKVLHEMRQLPEADLLELLGYAADALPAPQDAEE